MRTASGITLFEMLVALAVTLIMMGAVVTVFGLIAERVPFSFRGMRVKLRVYEPSSKQVRETTSSRVLCRSERKVCSTSIAGISADPPFLVPLIQARLCLVARFLRTLANWAAAQKLNCQIGAE